MHKIYASLFWGLSFRQLALIPLKFSLLYWIFHHFTIHLLRATFSS